MKVFRQYYVSFDVLMTVLVVAWQLVSPLNLPAANVSWSAGSGTDLLWNTASNWSGSVAPTSTDDLNFPGVIPNPGILLSPQIITLGTGSLANSLRFSNSYTLTSGDLNLTSGNITADLGTYSIIASQLIGTTGLTLTGTASSGRGAVRLTNATNTYTGATTINSGTLSIDSNGALGLDASTVIITGTNSAGSLMLGGGYTTGFTLARNVQISDGSASGMGNVAVGQSSVTAGIALMSLGNNTLSGSLTSVVGTGSVNTGVTSAFGQLTLGNVATGGVAVTNMTTFGSGIVSGSIGNYAITGTLSGAGSVQKAGLGTLILAPTDATGFSGTLRISGGSVRIGSGAVLGTNAGTTTSSTIDLNGNTGAILEVRSDTPAIGKNVYVRSAVTTNSIFADHAVGSSVINQTATFGILAFEQGQTTTFNGRDGYGMTFSTAPVQTATGNSVFTNNLNGPLTFTGAFWSQANNAAARTMTINGTGDTFISGAFTASAAAFDHVLTKAGTGTLTLSSTSGTLDGAVNIQAGTLAITDFRSILLTSASAINIGATTVAGTLNIGTTTAATAAGLTAAAGRAINLAGTTGGATINANQTFNAPVIFTAPFTATGGGLKTLTLGGTSIGGTVLGPNTINGAIVDSTAATLLVKADSGTWQLAGVNTYTGNTTVTGGTLKIKANAGTASTVIDQTGAIIFNANATTLTAGGTLEFLGFSGSATTETLGALTPTAGAGTVKLTAASASPAATNLIFTGLGTVAKTSGVNFDTTGGSTGTVAINSGFAAATATTLPGSGHLYLNGSNFANSDGSIGAGVGGLVVAPTYSAAGAIFTTAPTVLTAAKHNLLTGSYSQPAVTISSLKIDTAQTLTLTGKLTINLGAAATEGNILVTGGVSAAIGTSNGSLISSGVGAGTIVIRTDAAGDTLTLNTNFQSEMTGGFTKNGLGKLVINAVNAQTGATTINEGTVQLSGTGRLSGTSIATVIRQGAILDLNGVSSGVAIGSLDGAGTIRTTTGTATLTVGNVTTGAGIFSGIMEDGGGVLSVSVTGTTGSPTWSGLNTYSGVTTIGTGLTTTAKLVNVPILANYGTASSIGKGNLTLSDANNSASLVFAGLATAGISYTGTTSVSIDRLFTFNGGFTGAGGQIANASGNNSALILDKATGAKTVLFGAGAASTPQTLTLGGVSTGDSQFNYILPDNGANRTSLSKIGVGTWFLGGTNTYTGSTTITAGVLGATSGTTLPTNSPLVFGGGQLLTSGNFTRGLVATATPGNANEITWTASGGFAANDAKLVVAIGSLAAPSSLTWASGGFVTTGNLILNSASALSEVEFRNPIDLAAATRTIQVDDNANTFTDFATITGVISGATGSNISKTGTGTLQLLGANTYVGSTAVTAGTLVVTSLGNSTVTGVATSVGTSTGANLAAQAITLGSATTTAGTLVYVGAGETSDRAIIFGGTTTAAPTIVADGSGPLVLSGTFINNVGTTKTLALRGSNNFANEITSVLADNGGSALSVSHDSPGTWILSGNNSYTGNTTITAGSLGAGHDNAFGATLLSINNGTIFASGADRTIATPVTEANTTNSIQSFVGDYSLNFTGAWTNPTTTASGRFIRNNIVSGKTLTISGPYTFTAAITSGSNWNFDGSGDTIINGAISQTGGSTTQTAAGLMGITYAGTGSLTLGNAGNAYLGATTIASGTLKLSADGVIPDGVLSTSATTTLASTASTTVTAPTAGLYVGMAFTGAGVAPNSTIASITNSSSFVANVAQTIAVSEPLSFSIGRGNFVISPTAAITATLDLNGRTETINGLTATSAGNAVINNTSASPASLTFGSNNQLVSFVPTGTGTISNTGGGALSIIKTGSALATISNSTLTYTGATSVTGGTLTIASALNGTTALSSTGTGSNLNLTGGLSLPGSITSVTVGGGAFLSFLDGVGTPLSSLGTLNLGAGSGTATLSLELGATSDTLTASALTIANTLTFNLSGIGGLLDSTVYDLLVAPASSFTGLVGTNYFLGSQPGGFSSGTLSVLGDGSKIQYTSGAAIVGNLYWNNTQATGSWATNVSGATNFTSDLAGTTDGTFTPGPGTTAIFGSTNTTTLPGTTFTTSLDANFTVKGLQFTANPTGVTAWTVNAGTPATSNLTIKANGIDVAANAGAVTLNPNVILGAAQNWSVDGGGANGSSLTATGIISGNGFLLTKTGAGTLNLSGVNTFDGGLTIKAGTVIATVSNKALGGTTGTGTVTLGDSAGGGAASLLIGTTGLTYANPIVLATGATGPLTIGNTNDISITLSGGVTGTNHLTIQNDSATAAARTIAFTLQPVNNAGTVTNQGTSTGTVTISGGIGSNVTSIIENSATSALTISTTALNVNPSGTTLQQLSSLKVLTVSAAIQGTGNLIVKNDGATPINAGVTISGGVNNIGTITNNGTGANSIQGVLISGIIGTNVTGVIQDSAVSSLNLQGANTFTSGITIKKGILELATVANSGGGVGNVITLGDSAGGNDAALRFQSNVTYNANQINVAAGSSGTLSILGSRTTGATIIQGPIVLSNNLTIGGGDAGATTAAPTFTGGMTGTGNLTITYSATALTGSVVFSTNPINITGTIINNGNTTGTTTISGGIGSNVRSITENSTTSALTISTNPISVNSAGTTIKNDTVGTAKILTVSSGVTGTGNLIIQNNAAIAAAVTFTTNAINNAGTITNSGINAGTGTVTITGGIGSNVTQIIQASTTSALTISKSGASTLEVNGTGTTLQNTLGTKVLTISSGVTGTGDLIIKNDSATAAGITLTTNAVNNVGKVTNSGTNAGTGTVTITGGIGVGVTQVIQNSTASALTVTGTTAVDATGKIFQNLLGTKALAINGGVTGTGDIVIKNDSALAAGVTFGTALVNNIGKVTNSGTNAGTGTVTITNGIGANVTDVIQASTTSALTVSGAGTTVVGAGGKTLQNTLGGKALTISGGVTGTGDLVIKNDSTLAAGVTIGTVSLNHIGSVTNSGSGSGSATITGGVGANVTAITENSTSSALTISGTALTVNASGTTLTNSNASGSSLFTLSAGVANTAGNLILNNNSSITGGLTLSTSDINNIGTITNSGSGSGSTIISAIVGASVTGVIQNSATSQLTLTNSNTYATAVSINLGTVSINNVDAIATNAQALGVNTDVNLGVAAASSGTLLYTGAAGTLAKNINALGNGSDTVQNSGSGLLTLSGTLTKNGTTLTLKGGAGGIEVTGVIAGASAGSDLVLEGGTTTLSVANTYNGPTTVKNSGTLSIAADDRLGVVPGSATANYLILNNGALATTATFTLASNRGIALNGTGGQFNVASSTQLDYGGIASGAGALEKAGAGTLVLTGANDYGGGTQVSAGTLIAAHNTALGTGSVLVNSGGTLSLQGGITTAGLQTLSMGNPTAGDSILNSLSGNNTWGGSISANPGTAAGRVRILSSTIGDLLTLSGDITLTNGSSADLVIGGDGNGVINGQLISGTSTSTLFKSSTGSGTWTLNGDNSATFNGRTTISNGTIQISSENNLGITPGSVVANRLTIGGSANNGTLKTTANMSISANRGITLGSAGGTFSTNASTTLTVNSIVAGASGGALTKTGTGTLALTAGSSYTGATNINFGILEVSASDALGTNAGSTAVASGAALKLTGVNYSTAESLTINGTGYLGGGALVNSGTSSFAGAITAATNATINAGGGTLNLSGGLVKDGTVLTLTGGGTINISNVGISGASAGSDLVIDATKVITGIASSYNGPTYVTNNGTLEANNTSGSATGTGTVTVDAGSTLSGNGLISTGAGNSIFINGTLQIGASGATQGSDFSLTTGTGGSTIFGLNSLTRLDLWSTTGLDQSGDPTAADMLRLFGEVSILSGSTLKLSNPNNITFQAGDVFRLFDWFNLGTGPGSRTGTWSTIDALDLNLVGLGVDTTNLYTTTGALAGTISIIVVPEPSRVLLVGLGLAGLFMRRRRPISG